MGECKHCGKSNHLTRKCNHCGVEYCMEHTLPEKHNCPGLDRIGDNTKHLQSDISAKLSGDYKEEKTFLGRVKETVSPKSSAEIQQENKNPPTKEAPGDQSPDVAPDGSLVQKDTELDKELDRIRRDATKSQNSRLRGIVLRFQIWGKRFKSMFFDLRLWFLLVLVAVGGQLGYINLPGFPI